MSNQSRSETAPPASGLWQAILDALPASVAVLESTGRIVAVNRAWREFALENGGGTADWVGMDYLAVAGAAIGTCAEADAACRGIRAVLDGSLARFSLDYPCHSDATTRWFQLEVTLARDAKPPLAVVMHRDITDRKRAEEKLRETEAMERLILSSVDAVVYMASTSTDNPFHGAVRFVGGRVESTIGHTPDDFLQNKGLWMSLIHPEDMSSLTDATQSLYRSKRPGTRYYRIRHKTTGAYRWMEDLVAPQLDESGAMTGIFGVARDITDRKLAEDTLRESEERFRRLVEEVKDYSITLLDPGGIVTTWNRGAEQITGYTDAEVIGRHLAIFYSPEDVSVEKPQRVLAAAAARGRLEEEGWRVRKDGSRFWAECLTTALRTETGAIRGYIRILRDITDRRREQESLHSMLNHSIDAIVTIDGGGVIQSCGGSIQNVTGYSATELIGRNVSVLMPEPNAKNHDSYLADYLRTRQPNVIGRLREVVGLKKDGTEFPMELVVNEFALDGSPFYTGLIRDITARKHLESQLHQSQKMEAIGQLAGGVAHDFNNLLTVISGYTELLLQDLSVGDPHRESVVAIREAGDRAASLTRQLLAFGRKQLLQPVVLDLNRAIQQCEKMLRRMIEEDIQFVSVLEPSLDRVRADPTQIEQILLNLVVNARDAMPEGGRLTIRTRNIDRSPAAGAEDPSNTAGRDVELAVTDTGHGMSDEVKSNIFEPFFTTKSVGKGTGLGLAVVHGIVAQSGGQIRCESEEGSGTTFTIVFPSLQVPATRATASPTNRTTQGTETILLVEDEDSVRRIARIVLRGQGYQVLEAAGGEEAIRLSDGHRGEIHLLVSDVVMPQMNGRELVECLQARRPGMPVLYMSGYSDDAVFRHGIVESRDAFLQKPFAPLTLAQKVRSVLDEAGRR